MKETKKRDERPFDDERCYYWATKQEHERNDREHNLYKGYYNVSKTFPTAVLSNVYAAYNESRSCYSF